MDLTGLFRVWNPQYRSYSVFGQDHLAKVLLNWDTSVGGHDAGGGAGPRSSRAQAQRSLMHACIAGPRRGADTIREVWTRAVGRLFPAGDPSPARPPPALHAACPVRPTAVGDALKSIRLFKLYQQLQASPAQWTEAQAALLASPPAPSFARQNPSFEGVCMGNRKTCTCGAPFLG